MARSGLVLVRLWWRRGYGWGGGYGWRDWAWHGRRRTGAVVGTMAVEVATWSSGPVAGRQRGREARWWRRRPGFVRPGGGGVAEWAAAEAVEWAAVVVAAESAVVAAAAEWAVVAAAAMGRESGAPPDKDAAGPFARR